MNRYKNTEPSAPPPRAKRYYKRAKRFPEGVDRLDAEIVAESNGQVQVTERQIERWVDELFLSGGMKAFVGYVILRHGAWEAAMNCARQGHSTTAFRSSWALEWAYEQAAPSSPTEPHNLPAWFFDRLVNDFTATTNGSVHRIYAKIICDRIRFGGVHPTDVQAERLAEKCFDLVIDQRVKTAVMFWCLEILCDMAPRLDWVATELPDTVRRISESRECSPGMRVATREILKRLK